MSTDTNCPKCGQPLDFEFNGTQLFECGSTLTNAKHFQSRECRYTERAVNAEARVADLEKAGDLLRRFTPDETNRAIEWDAARKARP